MAINIGAGAIDRSTSSSISDRTVIDLTSPSDGTGTLAFFSLWLNSSSTSVKMGTFYGSGDTWTARDSELLGSVTSGSKQTFSGLNCAVSLNDIIGVYGSSGGVERDSSGGSGVRLALGDKFSGTNTFSTLLSGDKISLEGTSELPVGKKWNGITISKWNGVTVSKINGV